MCLIIHIHVVDEYSLGVVGDVGGTEVANVILGILQVEPVAECFYAHLNKLRLSRLHGGGIRLVIDGRGYALDVSNCEAVDAVLPPLRPIGHLPSWSHGDRYCFKNQTFWIKSEAF